MMAIKDLRSSDMMAHLLDALERGQDIGHYGRLVFAMVARHFIDEQQLLQLLMRDPHFDERQARALVQQVQGRDYNPPPPDKIRAWQRQPEFPACPNLAAP